MALLVSPIDGSPMRQIKRFGIEIDVCPTSGGIWLDKGELEKLIAMLKEEAAGEQMNEPAMNRQRDNFGDDDYDDDDDDDGYHGGNRGRRQGNQRGGRMSRFMDIFDF